MVHRTYESVGWLLVALAMGCSNLADGTRQGRDAGRPDVLPGLNPDGVDPFGRRDASLFVDGSFDTGVWQLPDTGSVFDQRYAFIWVGAYMTEAVEGAYASAEFRLVPRAEDPRCSYVSAANWDVITCTEEGMAPPDPHPAQFPNAGRITVEGGTQTVALPLLASGAYQYFYEQSAVFRGPRQVRVRAAGSQSVAPFMVAATIPSPIEVTEPSLGPGTAWQLTRERDLAVAWRSADARSVYVSIAATGRRDGVRTSVRVIAEFVGAAGRGTIPARALRGLFEVSATTVTVAVTPQNLVTQRVGLWPLQVTASGRAVNAVVGLQ